MVNEKKFYVINGDEVNINLYSLANQKNISKILDELFNKYLLNEEVSFNYSTELIYKNYKGHSKLFYYNDNQILHLQRAIAEIIIYIKSNKIKSIEWLRPDVETYNFSIKHAVRYGNVELRVIEAWLKDPDAVYEIARQLAKEIKVHKILTL